MKVALAGYGQEGESSFKYWKSIGSTITIFDEKKPTRDTPENAETCFGPEAFSKMNGFDLVIRTAGLNPDKIISDSKVWSATNEFFEKCPAEIIGVTGTKGKGTTASLITEILRAAGKTVHLLGNIGVPALDVFNKIRPNDLVVFELSSFQLWDLERSPQTAVVLMIEADHMDVHTSMAQYVEAKSNIGKNQKPEDLLIYHPNNKYSAEVAATSSAQKRRYMTPEGAHVLAGMITIEEQPICSTAEVGLLGAHNIENICAAITATWSYTQDVAAIKEAVLTFKGLPHRLEVIATVNGVTYIDDSFSSASGATIAAVKSFIQPEILICGGFDRGLDYTDLVKKIAEQPNIKKVLLIGQTAHTIADLLHKHNFANYEVAKTEFAETVKRASNLAEHGDIVLLSPGCASFDMFKNFKDRGEQFKQSVEEL